METTQEHRICTRCAQSLPLDAFFRDPRSAGGRKRICGACCTARKRALRHAIASGEHIPRARRRFETEAERHEAHLDAKRRYRWSHPESEDQRDRRRRRASVWKRRWWRSLGESDRRHQAAYKRERALLRKYGSLAPCVRKLLTLRRDLKEMQK